MQIMNTTHGGTADLQLGPTVSAHYAGGSASGSYCVRSHGYRHRQAPDGKDPLDEHPPTTTTTAAPETAGAPVLGLLQLNVSNDKFFVTALTPAGARDCRTNR